MTEPDICHASASPLASTVGTTGDRFFVTAAREIAARFGTRWALIGEVVGDDAVRVRGAWGGHELADVDRYSLSGTPCEQVAVAGVCCYFDGVATRFPRDRMLRELGVRSYLGAPVRGIDGRVLGLVAAFGDEPQQARPDALALLELFASRVAAEFDRHRHDQHLQHLQRLESLGVLVGGIAHDYDNLLVGMLANLEHARAELRDSPALQESIAGADAAARAAADLTRQLRSYTGRAQRHRDPVDVARHVRECARLVGHRYGSQASLRLDVGDDLPTVLADATQLRQVVLNLLCNADEALPGGRGNVRLSARCLPAYAPDYQRAQVAGDGFDVARRHVVVEVHDDGVGMDETTAMRAFEPFYSRKPGEDRGLGLAAVLGIVRQHDGAIAVRTAPGRGTTVTLMLPAGEAVSPVERATAVPEATRGALGARVLVVDDNDIVRATLRRTLEMLECEVVACATGEEALSLYRDRDVPFDGVIADRVMPGMDGLEVLRAIREMDPDARLVLTTGMPDTERDRVAQLGADLLEKPWTLAEVRELARHRFAVR